MVHKMMPTGPLWNSSLLGHKQWVPRFSIQPPLIKIFFSPIYKSQMSKLAHKKVPFFFL